MSASEGSLRADNMTFRHLILWAFAVLMASTIQVAAQAVVVAEDDWLDVSANLRSLDLGDVEASQSAFELTLQAGPSGADRMLLVALPRVVGAGALGTGVGHLDPPIIRPQSGTGVGNAGPPLGVSWNGQGWVARITVGPNQLLRLGIATSSPRISVALATQAGLQARSERDGRMRALLFGAALMLIALAWTRAMLARDGLHGRAALLSLALAIVIAVFADWHSAFISTSSIFLGSVKAGALAFFVAVAIDLARKAMDLEHLSPVPNAIAVTLALISLVLGGVVIYLPLLGGLVGPFAVLVIVLSGIVVIEGTRQNVTGPKYLFGPWLLLALAGAIAAVLAVFFQERSGADYSILIQALMLAGTLTATLAVDRLRAEVPVTAMAAVPDTSVARGGELRLKNAIKGAGKGVWDWRINGDRLYLSDSAMALMGYKTEGGEGSEEAFFARLHADDREAYREKLRSEVDRGEGHFRHDFRVLHEGGEYRWLRLEAEVTGGGSAKSMRLSGLLTDVTNEKGRGKRASLDALHDPLTGLAGRALFLDRLVHVDAQAGNAAGPAAIVLDVDRFDSINDGIGHAGGDTLLIMLARRLEGVLEPGDLGARLGGDEFGVLVELATDHDRVIDLADTLRDVMCEAIEIEGQELFPSISIGVAFAREHTDSPHPLLRRAEIAMYHAKAAGGARVELFRPALAEKKGELMSLEAGLSRALERKEVELVYQPVISMEDGRIAGFEALMRWNHPEHGMMTPDRFLSLAEDTGAIVPLGRYVLEAAARQLHAWQTGFKRSTPLFVAVNLSARQILGHDIARDVERIFERIEIAPRTLIIEVTETVIMENPELAARRLHALRAEGIGLAIDDFGTGYSALSHLNRFPFNQLKIDRKFVEEMEEDEHVEKVVKAIANLARDLQMETVGEGIQNETQMAMLKRMGCDYGQGYLIGKPVTAPEAERMIMKDVVSAHHETPKPSPDMRTGGAEAQGASAKPDDPGASGD